MVRTPDKLLRLVPRMSELFARDPHLHVPDIYSDAAAIGATVLPIV